jgi:prepilin-type N-terminal cleavage/methylation domain-containing protein
LREIKYISLIINEKGYTILEVMIASAIFAVVLIPMVALLGNVLIKYSTSDLITATNLAREEMEKTLHDRAFKDMQKSVQMGNVNYKIIKKVENKDDLLLIRVEVFRAKDNKALASIYTEKYLGKM